MLLLEGEEEEKTMIAIQTLRKENDFRNIIALSRDFFREYETHHEKFFQIDTLCDNDIIIIEYFTHSIESERGETFIAVAEGRIVGYITVFVRTQPTFYKIKRIGTISGLMVHKDYRRRGIARQLMAKATTFFAEREITYFRVYTATTNYAPITFYEHNDMIPLHTTMLGKVSD